MEYKKIVTESTDGFTARVYDGGMRIFLMQRIATKKQAYAKIRKFLKEQQAKIESGELLELDN